MSPPILTVVIPTLDEVSTVGRCLDAIGTAACVEVVVSDGGSTDMPWSTPQLLEATRGRLRALGVGWLELEPLHDLDTEADLRRALEGESPGGELGARLEANAGVAERAARP